MVAASTQTPARIFLDFIHADHCTRTSPDLPTGDLTEPIWSARFEQFLSLTISQSRNDDVALPVPVVNVHRFVEPSHSIAAPCASV